MGSGPFRGLPRAGIWERRFGCLTEKAFRRWRMNAGEGPGVGVSDGRLLALFECFFGFGGESCFGVYVNRGEVEEMGWTCGRAGKLECMGNVA